MAKTKSQAVKFAAQVVRIWQLMQRVAACRAAVKKAGIKRGFVGTDQNKKRIYIRMQRAAAAHSVACSRLQEQAGGRKWWDF